MTSEHCPGALALPQESSHAYVASGITGMAWATDTSNRLFVTIKSGTVRLVKNGALLAAPRSWRC